jgi:hypothetical protein
VVQADDFGMCHAVNLGVVRAFRRGILTQAALMVPCPWFMEAVNLVKEHDIPVGMHSTLTCDWDYMRWRPLTAGTSLVDSDGTFHRTVDLAVQVVDPDEAAAELVAQAWRMTAAGLTPLFFDTHMGLVCPEAYEVVCGRFERPFLYPEVDPHPDFDSISILSAREREEKRAWFLDYLAELAPGTHLLQTHPGTPSPELKGLVAEESPVSAWAERYRVSDLELLIDPEVVRLVAQRSIEPVSLADLYADLSPA